MAIQLKQFFKTAVALKNRFLTGDKPTQAVFADLFDSVTFKKESSDTATTAQQGLSKAALDTEAAAFQLNNNADAMTRTVLPYQLPEVVAGDASIVVTPVLYRQTIGDVGVNVQGQTRRLFKVSAIPSALNEAWKTIGGGGTFENTQAVPGFTTACTNVTGFEMQVRKTASNKIAFRGSCVPTSLAWVPSDILFILPVGYRPAKNSFLSIAGFGSSIDSITFQTDGKVYVNGYSGAILIIIPEIEISID